MPKFPDKAYHKIRDTIAFFGSARFVDGEVANQLAEDARTPSERKRAESLVHAASYYEDAQHLARLFTEWSNALQVDDHRFVVCSGGGGGIMEAANRGARKQEVPQ